MKTIEVINRTGEDLVVTTMGHSSHSIRGQAYVTDGDEWKVPCGSSKQDVFAFPSYESDTFYKNYGSSFKIWYSWKATNVKPGKTVTFEQENRKAGSMTG